MTQREVRREFKAWWRDACKWQPTLETDKPAKRECFSNFIDSLAREGRISDRVAQNVTLEG